MSAGLRIFATPFPTQRGMAGVPIEPMTREQANFWRIIRERKETANGRSS